MTVMRRPSPFGERLSLRHAMSIATAEAGRPRRIGSTPTQGSAGQAPRQVGWSNGDGDPRSTRGGA